MTISYMEIQIPSANFKKRNQKLQTFLSSASLYCSMFSNLTLSLKNFMLFHQTPPREKGKKENEKE